MSLISNKILYRNFRLLPFIQNTTAIITNLAKQNNIKYVFYSEKLEYPKLNRPKNIFNMFYSDL